MWLCMVWCCLVLRRPPWWWQDWELWPWRWLHLGEMMLMEVMFPYQYVLLVQFVALHMDSCWFMDWPIQIWLAWNLSNFKNVWFFDIFDPWCTLLTWRTIFSYKFLLRWGPSSDPTIKRGKSDGNPGDSLPHGGALMSEFPSQTSLSNLWFIIMPEAFKNWTFKTGFHSLEGSFNCNFYGFKILFGFFMIWYF